MILHFAENNVGQCWNCANCVGKISYPLAKVISTDLTSVWVFLPECKGADSYMTHVNSTNCPYWKSGEQNHEKQIPEKQDKHFIENEFGFFCCKETGKTIRYPLVSFTDLEYCPRCGQAIDWEKNDKRDDGND